MFIYLCVVYRSNCVLEVIELFLLFPDNDDEDEASRSEAEASIKHGNKITDDRMNGSKSTVAKLS